MDKNHLFNFSFVIDNVLAGMALPRYNDQLITLEKEHNVGLIVSVIETAHWLSKDLFENTTLKYLPLHVRNFSTPTFEQVDRFINAVERHQKNKKAVVVHCRHGNGRTGIFLTCYLMIKFKLKPSEAIERIGRVRKKSIENKFQRKFIDKYHDYKKTSILNYIKIMNK